ncbi:MAG: hypothetical protein RLZZ450_2573 [Pseudomonadota bacterium]|jgi:membrane fusion protein (multidrug efflux system)
MVWMVLLAATAAWLVWLCQARVAVRVRAEGARVEVARRGHVLAAPVSGRVLSSTLRLEQRVVKDQILVELDAAEQIGERERLLLERASSELQRRAIVRELETLERVVVSRREVARVRLDEAEIRREQTGSLARLRASESERELDLSSRGFLAQVVADRGASDVYQLQRELAAAQVNLRRIRAEQLADEAERAREGAALRKEVLVLDGRLSALDGKLIENARELERRRIRTPIAGTLGTMAALTAGTVVQQGDTLVTVVPSGDLRIVAEFLPARALGRIHAGQPGRMQLAGFPWTQYGTLAARVEHVGREVHGERVRVELAITDAARHGDLQHGLPGQLEITLEEVSPLVLALRAAGRRVSGP